MKKTILFMVLILFLPGKVNAQRGCCSHHGGVAGCASNGRQICNDGSLSPTCTCSPSSNSSISNSSKSNSSDNIVRRVYGCTDPSAYNYNSSANINDGSCIAKKTGCTDSSAINYDVAANISDSSCQYKKEIVEVRKIKFKTKYKRNHNKYKGEKRVIQKGKKGKKKIIYNVIYDNSNNEISREKIKEEIVEKPVNKVIEKGIKKKGFFATLFG